MTAQPLLLDLFCGAGGCGEGYTRAGFKVIGVDLDPRPLRHNPHECHQGDALAVLDTLLAGEAWQGYRLADFRAVRASPPCQANSVTRSILVAKRWRTTPDLVTPIYALFRHLPSDIAWEIENVPGAPMSDAVCLCGSMFGLPIRRHRWFASSQLLFAPAPCAHTVGFYNVVGGKVRGYGALSSGRFYSDKNGALHRRESYPGKAAGQRAMGIDWMTVAEMCEAIPPAYTEWLGRQLLTVVEGTGAA